MRVSWMERETNEWVLKTIKPEWTQESRVTGAFTVFWTCGETPRAREERAMENDVMIRVIEKAKNNMAINNTRQVTRATHVRNRICPRVKLIIKIIIILLIIFLGFIKSKSC